MKPAKTVTFALLILADLSLVLLLPFAMPAPRPASLPKFTITSPMNSMSPKSAVPPTEVDCDGDDVRTPWCEARYTKVI